MLCTSDSSNESNESDKEEGKGGRAVLGQTSSVFQGCSSGSENKLRESKSRGGASARVMTTASGKGSEAPKDWGGFSSGGERVCSNTPPSLETVGCPRRRGVGRRPGAVETWS